MPPATPCPQASVGHALRGACAQVFIQSAGDWTKQLQVGHSAPRGPLRSPHEQRRAVGRSLRAPPSVCMYVWALIRRAELEGLLRAGSRPPQETVETFHEREARRPLWIQGKRVCARACRRARSLHARGVTMGCSVPVGRAVPIAVSRRRLRPEPRAGRVGHRHHVWQPISLFGKCVALFGKC